MAEAFITIIIPAYNAASCIGQTIDSCMQQSNQDFNLIIVNDGSNDETAQLLDDIAAKHANVQVYHQANSGVAAARNVGIQKCSTPWLCFLDADDCIDKMFVDTCASILAKQPRLEGIIFQHNAVRDGHKKKVMRATHSGMLESSPFDTTENYPTVWAKAFNTAIIKQHNISFYPAHTLEDVFFTLEYCLHADKLFVSTACVYDYQYSEASLSRKINIQTLHKREEIVSAYYDKFASTYKHQPAFSLFFITRILKQLFVSTGKSMRPSDKRQAFEQSMEYCVMMMEKIKQDLGLSSIRQLVTLLQKLKVKFAFYWFLMIRNMPKKLAYNLMRFFN